MDSHWQDSLPLELLVDLLTCSREIPKTKNDVNCLDVRLSIVSYMTTSVAVDPRKFRQAPRST